MRLTRTQLLATATALLFSVGIVFSMVPFLRSWIPTDAVKFSHEVVVPVRDLPSEGLHIVEWQTFGVLIVMPERRGLLVYWWGGEYRLPEQYSEYHTMGCSDLAIVEDQLQCIDPSWKEGGWRQKTSRWNRDGSPRYVGLRALPETPLVEVGPNLIIGRVDT